MFDEDAVGFVAVWGWSNGGGYGGGHVSRKRVVLRVDARDAHLKLVGVGGVVNRFFLCDESRLEEMKERLIERLHAVL